MRPADVVGAATMVAKIATGQIPDSTRPVAKRVKGGKKRAEIPSPERRSQAAKKSPEARWGMSKLPLKKRVQILSMLVKGSPMHSIARACDVSINSVSKLLVDAGSVCANFHHERVQGVRSKRIHCNEIWSFRCSKAKNAANAKSTRYGAGDVWTWTALDADSELIVSWIVGDRDADAKFFMDDLQIRLAHRVELATQGYNVCLQAVSSANPTRAHPQWVSGKIDHKHISRSYVERHNLAMLMSMRRLTRLSKGFSNKLRNHCHALALYFFWHNWCRANKKVRVSPAMAAGLTDKLMGTAEIAAMVEAAAPKRGPPRRYGSGKQRAERDRLAALVQIEATEINPIKLIIREEWRLPADRLPEHLTGFANELRTRILAGQSPKRLYGRAAFVQVHDMKIPLSPAHRTLVDRVYALLGGENSRRHTAHSRIEHATNRSKRRLR
jgi:IS1 family transposase